MTFGGSDNKKGADIAQILDTMWTRFLPDIRQRAQVLEDAARSASAGKLSQSEREAAKSAAHKLAGTLGTFGLNRGTDLARELEHIYADATSTIPAERLSAVAAEIQSIIESRK